MTEKDISKFFLSNSINNLSATDRQTVKRAAR